MEIAASGVSNEASDVEGGEVARQAIKDRVQRVVFNFDQAFVELGELYRLMSSFQQDGSSANVRKSQGSYRELLSAELVKSLENSASSKKYRRVVPMG